MKMFDKCIVTQNGISKPVYDRNIMERLRHEPYKLSLSKQQSIIEVCSKKKCFGDLVNIIGDDFSKHPDSYRNPYLAAQGDTPVITFYRAQQIEAFHGLNIPAELVMRPYYRHLLKDGDDFETVWYDNNNNRRTTIRRRGMCGYMRKTEFLECINQFAEKRKSNLRDQELIDLIREDYIGGIKFRYDNNEYVTSSEILQDEKRIAQFCMEKMGEVSDFLCCLNKYQNELTKANREQKKAVLNALKNRISIIYGGPGRGKSWTINLICKIILMEKPKTNIIKIALAGKAANRLVNKNDKKDAKRCGTIDKKLFYTTYAVKTGRFEEDGSPEYENLTGYYYDKNAERKEYFNELPPDICIIDEMSMVSQSYVIRSINCLKKINPSIHIILVGDPDQLPNMGIGQVFKDMIDRSNIPKVELKEMKRTDRMDLMRLANAINDGKNISKFNPENPDAFVLKHITENPYCKRQFKQIIQDVIQEYNLDYNNSCFISAQKGNMKEQDGHQFVGSVNHCNIILQNIYNPNRMERGRNGEQIFDDPFSKYTHSGGWTKFRLGDLIYRKKNDYNDKEFIIFNGDSARIVGYDRMEFSVDIQYVKDIDGSNKQTISVTDLCIDYELAYAHTVHKKQGDDDNTEVVIVNDSHYGWCGGFGYGVEDANGKPLLYVACTRGKRRIILIVLNDVKRSVKSGKNAGKPNEKAENFLRNLTLYNKKVKTKLFLH
tara:strand:- start:27 stop:2177 length:2151 start_codon:yes stop_codon:yes gene_type:complete